MSEPIVNSPDVQAEEQSEKRKKAIQITLIAQVINDHLERRDYRYFVRRMVVNLAMVAVYKLRAAGLNIYAFSTLKVLARHSNDHAICYLSYDTIADEGLQSKSSARRAIEDLGDHGFIRRIGQRANGTPIFQLLWRNWLPAELPERAEKQYDDLDESYGGGPQGDEQKNPPSNGTERQFPTEHPPCSIGAGPLPDGSAPDALRKNIGSGGRASVSDGAPKRGYQEGQARGTEEGLGRRENNNSGKSVAVDHPVDDMGFVDQVDQDETSTLPPANQSAAEPKSVEAAPADATTVTRSPAQGQNEPAGKRGTITMPRPHSQKAKAPAKTKEVTPETDSVARLLAREMLDAYGWPDSEEYRSSLLDICTNLMTYVLQDEIPAEKIKQVIPRGDPYWMSRRNPPTFLRALRAAIDEMEHPRQANPRSQANRPAVKYASFEPEKTGNVFNTEDI